MIVAITTAPRPRPAIVESLRSLREDAGYMGDVALFDDGCGQDLPKENLFHFKNDPPLGSLPNFFRALEYLLSSKEPLLVLLEDDITWSKGAWSVVLEEFSKLKVPCLYSVHSSWTVTKPLEQKLGVSNLKPGVYDMSFNGRAGGSNAYFMPRTVAKKLYNHAGLQQLLTEFKSMSLEEINIQSRRDNRITRALISMRIPVMFRIPSLCHHGLGKLNSSEYQKRGAWETNYWESQARLIL
jgi:hypothetical protein